ncbi:MAG TPA: PadR family transcriptional regulator [Candidatus Binataceae bacterium]
MRKNGRIPLTPSGTRNVRSFQQTPPRMDIKFPILGFLMDSEMTGYDLKHRFQDPIGFFYRVSDGSLYPALKKLALERLVRMRTERQGKRTRNVYAITPSGREWFLRRLREPAQPLFVFDEGQVKIYFAQHDPAAAVMQMERMRREDVERAALLRALVEEMERKGAPAFHRIVVEIGRAATEAKARVLARLQSELRGEVNARRHGNGKASALKVVSK